jgi:hypothetical protein
MNQLKLKNNLKIFTNQMQPQAQQNENSSLIKAGPKDWTDNSTLDEIVKYEYQESNKSEYIQETLKILQKNQCKFLGDWKELCTRTTFLERSKITDKAGLVVLLDRLAGIKPENVSSRKNKTTKGRDTNRGKVLSLQQDVKNDCNSSYLGNLFDYLLYYFGSINLESNSGKSQHLHGTLEHMSVELDRINSNVYIGDNFDNNSLRKRK